MKIIISILFVFSYYFNFASDWIQRANFPASGRHRATGISIGNKGYMGLGHYNGAGFETIFSDWWEYDPATNSWTQKADFIGRNGNGDYGAIAFGTSTLGFVGPGEEAEGDNDYSFYAFNQASNTWTQVSDCPDYAADIEGFVINDNLYYGSWNNFFEYNTVTDVWTQKNSLPFDVDIWNDAIAVNDVGYIKVYEEFWAYDYLTDSWTQMEDFPGVADEASVALKKDNRVLLVTGWPSFTNETSELWEFDPVTETWTQKTDFVGSSRRFACGFNIGEKAFLGLGTNGTNFNDFWELTNLASIEEQPKSLAISISPNPSTGVFNFRIENWKGSYDLKVFDMTGKMVHEAIIGSGFSSLDLSNLSDGTYICHFENEEVLIKRKVYLSK